jgi:hypothetical protein
MLDNGYIYPAASRLSVYHSADNWALVFELFGFSPRAGLPDTTILTFSGRLSNRNPPANYVSAQAYQNYLMHNPHNEDRRVWPLADGDWIDPDDSELLNANATTFVLRGRKLETPLASAYRENDIELSEAPRVTVFEFCRWLAANHRASVLATAEERRVSLEPSLREILVLNDWNHPDLAGGELASQSETFRQLAQVLATGDIGHYRPTAPPNTHWRNWPEAGTL